MSAYVTARFHQVFFQAVIFDGCQKLVVNRIQHFRMPLNHHRDKALLNSGAVQILLRDLCYDGGHSRLNQLAPRLVGHSLNSFRSVIGWRKLTICQTTQASEGGIPRLAAVCGRSNKGIKK